MTNCSEATSEAEGNRLRKAELAAHGSSIVAVVLTALMVGTKTAEEANPAAAWLISQGGIETWALATPLFVAGGFAVLRAAARGFSVLGREIDGHAGAARLSAWVVVAALALDATGNLVATGLHGLPDSAPSLDLLQLTGALVAIATVLVLRRELLEAKRELSERVESVKRNRVAAAAFALLVVTAGLGGIALVDSDYSAVRNAAANSIIIDDFEDGDLAGWSRTNEMSINSTTTWEGTYSARIQGPSTRTHTTRSFSKDNDKNISARIRFETLPTSSGGTMIAMVDSAGPYFAAEVEVDSAGNVLAENGGCTSHTDTGINIQSGKWYRIQFENIDWSTGDYAVRVETRDGSLVGSNGRYSFCDAPSSVDQMRVDYYDADFNIDYLTTGDKTTPKKYTVSGTVTDTDGDAISGATVSDGNGNSTTTASDGSWSMDLPDDTYTLTASQSGYLNQSQSVKVDGSPVTGVNYTLVGQLRGFVKDAESGSVIDDATVETDGGTSDTTNATGFYSLPLADGDYSVSATGPDHGSESRDVTVAGATTANYSLCPSIGCGYYEQTFVLEDYTGEFYENGPSLFIYKFKGGDISDAKSIISDGEYTDDWEYENTRGFNHANESFYDLENHHYYAFIVVNEDAVDLSQTRGVYETGPYLANETNGPKTLQIGRPANETNTSEACSIFTSDDNGLELICSGENPVSEFDFGITMPDGSIYDDSISFDSPQDYYEGELPQDVLDNYTNSTSAAEDVVIDYSGTYGNGSSFNGTSSLLGSTGGGSQSFSFGPVDSGGGSGGGAQQIGGFLLLAGGAAVAYRRFGTGGVQKAASSAASSAGDAVRRLRGRG